MSESPRLPPAPPIKSFPINSIGLPDVPGYDVEEEIGRGGMGVVYRARKQGTGRLLALKMILGDRGATFQEFARFRIEAEAMACLNHPNIIKIREVGLFAGHAFFALDYADKGSLKNFARQQSQTPRESTILVKTLAHAIQHAHDRGMLHRDLKPANVLLMADGTPVISDFGLVKFADPAKDAIGQLRTISISDFDLELRRYSSELGAQYGVSRYEETHALEDYTRSAWEQCATRTGLLGDKDGLRSVQDFMNQLETTKDSVAPRIDDLTSAGAILGSPNYMAPEQAMGKNNEIGTHTDVYALGGILYELLTGQPPFTSEGGLIQLKLRVFSVRPIPPRRIRPNISPAIEAICLKCLEKEPGERYPSAFALAEDLDRFLNGYSPSVALYTQPAIGETGPSTTTDAKPIAFESIGSVPTVVPSPAGEKTPPNSAAKQTPPSIRVASTWKWWPFGKSTPVARAITPGDSPGAK